MKARSLSHVGVTVTDFENAVRWYHDTFGCYLISELHLDKEQVEGLYELYGLKDTSIRIGFLRFPKGGVIEIFEFSPTLEKSKVKWNQPGYTHVALDVKNVNKVYQCLKAKGVQFYSEPQKNNGSDWVFLKDPDGNLIEIMDLKFNYHAIRLLGGIVGRVMKHGSFKKYYRLKE
ncbi:VOC family protein [Vallitalea okinawensis]|uniref:VOC family protein n=1 Tax=Vallitalea okinawensis TaxID=2078660 RepID=UPI00130022CE|nr:VOC family protein [Vallitalea okinawensis]